MWLMNNKANPFMMFGMGKFLNYLLEELFLIGWCGLGMSFWGGRECKSLEWTGSDYLELSFSSNGFFFHSSLYMLWLITEVYAVWKLQIPPRVQIFLWLLTDDRLLSKDNLAKRREVLDQSCLFCKEQETIIHMFFECAWLRECGVLEWYRYL